MRALRDTILDTILATSFVALLAIAGPARLVHAAPIDDRNACRDLSGAAAIAACTRAINSGSWRGHDLAILYFFRAAEYAEQHEIDRAIADYSESIKFDDNSEDAFYGRGQLYAAKGDFDQAIMDYNEAIKQNRENAYFYANRAAAYVGKGDFDHAIADYDQAIRFGANNANRYRSRGIAYLYKGDPTMALADVGQATKLDPKNAYSALWLDIISQRKQLPGRLSQAISAIDMTKWPAPVLRMYLGQVDLPAALASADDADAETKKGRVCEVNFYGGELALQKGTADEKVRLFQLAANDCPKDFDEWSAANAELKSLGGSR